MPFLGDLCNLTGGRVLRGVSTQELGQTFLRVLDEFPSSVPDQRHAPRSFTGRLASRCRQGRRPSLEGHDTRALRGGPVGLAGSIPGSAWSSRRAGVVGPVAAEWAGPDEMTNSGHAEVAELADAQASGACGRKVVEVQILSSAPILKP